MSLAKGQPPLLWKNGQADPTSTSLTLAVRWISRRYSKEAAWAFCEFLCLSRISPNLASNSPMVRNFANGHYFSNAGHFPAAPFTAHLSPLTWQMGRLCPQRLDNRVWFRRMLPSNTLYIHCTGQGDKICSQNKKRWRRMNCKFCCVSYVYINVGYFNFTSICFLTIRCYDSFVICFFQFRNSFKWMTIACYSNGTIIDERDAFWTFNFDVKVTQHSFCLRPYVTFSIIL